MHMNDLLSTSLIFWGHVGSCPSISCPSSFGQCTSKVHLDFTLFFSFFAYQTKASGKSGSHKSDPWMVTKRRENWRLFDGSK